MLSLTYHFSVYIPPLLEKFYNMVAQRSQHDSFLYYHIFAFQQIMCISVKNEMLYLSIEKEHLVNILTTLDQITSLEVTCYWGLRICGCYNVKYWSRILLNTENTVARFESMTRIKQTTPVSPDFQSHTDFWTGLWIVLQRLIHNARSSCTCVIKKVLYITVTQSRTSRVGGFGEVPGSTLCICWTRSWE